VPYAQKSGVRGSEKTFVKKKFFTVGFLEIYAIFFIFKYWKLFIIIFCKYWKFFRVMHNISAEHGAKKKKKKKRVS
jgi:hypothetical protein